MEFHNLLIGIIVGFTLAVPIGPIGFLCIRQTLEKGRLPGLIVGLGGATADFLYSGIAAFGLTIISNVLDTQRIWIRLIGGAIIVILGINIFRTKHKTSNVPLNSAGMLKSYIETFLFTLTNPLTVFAFITVFAALGLAKGINHFSAALLAFGVFIGSMLWFLLLNSFVSLIKHKVGQNWSLRVNKITGSLIMISGIVTIVSLL